MNTWESHIYCRSSCLRPIIVKSWYNLENFVISKYENAQGDHMMQRDLISFLKEWRNSRSWLLSGLIILQKGGQRDGNQARVAFDLVLQIVWFCWWIMHACLALCCVLICVTPAALSMWWGKKWAVRTADSGDDTRALLRLHKQNTQSAHWTASL